MGIEPKPTGLQTDQTARTTAPGPAPAGKLSCVPWPDLEPRIAEWDELANAAAEPNPFFESWYLLPSLRALRARDVRLLIYEEAGRLRGLMPVLRSARYYRWPLPHIGNWLHPNCFLGAPLVGRGSEAPFWRALLDWADESPGTALFLHLRAMALEGPLHAALLAVAGEQRRIEVVQSERRAMLQSDLPPDAYWERSLSAKKRKELRRQANRLGEAGALRIDRCGDDRDLARWTDDFVALEAAGWKGRSGSALASSPDTSRLFRDALAGACARGRLERLTLSLDDRPIAMLASFIAPPGAFSFKTAFDEDYARFSPGVLLQQENLAILERRDIAWSDSCAAADHPMIDHIWRERREIGRLSIAIGGALRRSAFSQVVSAEMARGKAAGTDE